MTRSRGSIGAGGETSRTGNPGRPWSHQDCDDASLVDIVGQVVESDPPRRLVITWADPAEAHDPEKHSRVTFEIKRLKDGARLTVTHDELEPGSGMLQGITQGWPLVLSSLKTFLETGKAMAMTLMRDCHPGE